MMWWQAFGKLGIAVERKGVQKETLEQYNCIHDIYFQDPSEHARIFSFDISSGNKIMYCFKPSSSFI